MRLNCPSPAINVANNSALPDDDFDLDLNPATTVIPHDRLAMPRIAGAPANVDMGAFEKPYTAQQCPGEVAGGCRVDINDLLVVISAWGSCTVCTYDISPQPCGDGTIDI